MILVLCCAAFTLCAAARPGPFQLGGKLPFDKLRANGQAFSFALSLSKGEFAPN
jgi:hypothetical protein